MTQTEQVKYQQRLEELREENKQLTKVKNFLLHELERIKAGAVLHQVELTFIWMRSGVAPSVKKALLTDAGIKQCQQDPDLARTLCDITADEKDIQYKISD